MLFIIFIDVITKITSNILANTNDRYVKWLILLELYAIVATAMRRVSGIECESANKITSFIVSMFKNTKEANILEPIIRDVINRAFKTKSFERSELNSKVEPM